MGQLSELLVQMAALWQQHFLLNDMVEPKAGTREAGALGSMKLGAKAASSDTGFPNGKV